MIVNLCTMIIKMISLANFNSAKNILAMVCNSRLETSSYCQFKLIRDLPRLFAIEKFYDFMLFNTRTIKLLGWSQCSSLDFSEKNFQKSK